MKQLEKLVKRKKFISVMVLVLFALFTKAQTEFYFVPHTTGNNVRLDVISKDFDALLSVQFSIHWDPDAMGFQSYGNVHPDIEAVGSTNYGINDVAGEYVTFLLTDLDGLSLDDGATLFSIFFEKLNNDLTEIAVSEDLVTIEVANVSGEIIDAVFHSAFVNTGSVTGRVVYDENANCNGEITELGLSNWKVKATATGGVYYGLTREDGRYTIYVPDGDYQVEVIQNNEYYEEGCVGATAVNIVNQSNAIVDFFPHQTVTCPYMEVDISTAILRRCFPGTYTVKYCNYGTATAEGVTLEVTLDDLITVDSTQIPILGHDGNTYSFDLGEVAIGECNRFKIFYTIDCDAVLGQTQCAEAHIYPDSSCVVPNPEWSGAFIEVNGRCEGSNVNFTIENTGIGDMVDPGGYIIIEDGVLLTDEPTEFLLASGESIEVSYEANGATYVAKANQVANYPGQSMPIAAIEACGTNGDGTFSLGYITQFYEDDEEPFLSTDCQEVVGSYDTNSKRGYPKGYSDHHYIDRNQDIEYLINFQNTGTDTAFNVVVKDVISPYLDRASIVFEASSHPYEADFYGDTLIFRFDEIILPDSNANEAASHGFVKFRISQKVNLPIGTIINNEAVIHFDFNEPITTNTTAHEIGENYLVLNIEETYLKNLNIIASPNPFMTATVVNLEGVDFKRGEWALYDVLGKRVNTATFYEKSFRIFSNGLSNGTYFLKVSLDGSPAGTGKLIVNNSGK